MKKMNCVPFIRSIKKLLRIMKITAVVVFVLSMHVYASSYGQVEKISLVMNSTLRDVIEQLEQVSGYHFVLKYDAGILDKKVDVKYAGEKIEYILDDLLKDTGLSYKIIDRYIAITSNEEHASGQQQKEVSGKVTDSAGTPLPGVTVVVKGTTNGIITDSEGIFLLSKVPVDGVLIFSYIGMKSQEVSVSGKSSIIVEMTEMSIGVDEVVVVGYGTQKKSDITGSVASFKAENLQQMPQVNILQSLQGNVAGLNISQTSSDAEGNSMSMQIRGQNSITAKNSPLVILDGIPYAGLMSEINPVEISSVEILKDASSSAIYGARAANGVILITTKRGGKGKPKIAFDSYYGIEQIANLPDMMDGETFYNRKADCMGESIMSKTETDSYNNGIYTDWVDLATRMGSRQQQSLSISGGTEATSYFISGTYNQVQGIAKNDDFSRFNLRTNIDTKITNWLSFGSNTTMGYFDRSGLPANFTEAFVMNPLAVPYQEDGKSVTLYPWPEDPGFVNPLEPIKYINENKSRQIVTNNYLLIDLPFVKGLSCKVNTGYTFRNSTSETYKGRDTQVGYEKGGASEVLNKYYEDWILENILNYQREFDKHSLFLTAMYSTQQTASKSHSISAEGFPNDVMTYFQPGKATLIEPSASYSKENYISQMIRANYSYDGRYLLTVTARRDGYSAFGENNKFGLFPSVAVGWNINRESFMSTYSQWLNRLKLRASYGENGNQAVSAYSTLPRLTSLNYLGGNHQTAIGFYPSMLGDANLGWETTKSLNFGVDFGFLENRLQGTFDVFFSNTFDLLLDKTISPVNGTTSIRQNIGETKNSGFEFQISSININHKDFKWTTDLNISRYHNEIVNIGLTDDQGSYIDDISNKWFIGKPVDVNFGYVMDGIWQENEDIANSHMPVAKPGDIKLKDVYADGKITPEDRTIIGSLVPDFTAGITNNLSYKNFSLTFFIYTLQGVTRQNTLITLAPWNYRRRGMDIEFWTPENQTNKYPANKLPGTVNPYSASFYEDASFIRLKDVTLAYKFPKKLIDKWSINQLECYVNAKNLWTITKWSGLDPELDNQEAIPLTKTFIFGIRLGL